MNKKQELRDKVKEIKQRQQNWMKQRAESHGSPGGETSSTTKGGTPQKMTAKSQSSPSHQKPAEQSSQSSIKNLISSSKSKAKFQNWLKAKETNEDKEVNNTSQIDRNHNNSLYNSEKYSDNQYTDQSYRDHKGSSSVNVLRVPSTRSPEFATPDPSWNSDDETGEITAAQLLSPDDFDSRADDIIAKVKGDLAISNYDYNRKPPVGNTYQPSTDKPAEQELSNHVCPTCEKLMMPPNSPMLLIPCGHTLCGTCSKKTKFCAICGCGVQSTTLNIMLQQIITNFHTKQTHRQTTKKSTITKSAPRNNYQEEYHNLLTRKEILQEESENISKNVQKLTRKLNQDKQQVASIQKREEEVELEIEELQRKLKQLSEHKLEYEKNCYTHEIEVKQEKNRLVLVKDSLVSVEQQIEKVKLLAESDY